MSGSFNELDVPPTLVSFAVGMSEASKTASAQFKRAGSKVVMAELPVDEETGLPAYEKAMAFMVSVYEGYKKRQYSFGKRSERRRCSCLYLQNGIR